MRRLKEKMIFQIANLVDQRQLVPLRHLLGLVGHVGQVDQINDNDMFASTTEEWLAHNVPIEEMDFFSVPLGLQSADEYGLNSAAWKC